MSHGKAWAPDPPMFYGFKALYIPAQHTAGMTAKGFYLTGDVHFLIGTSVNKSLSSIRFFGLSDFFHGNKISFTTPLSSIKLIGGLAVQLIF